ncbi:MAG: hypothetical protein LUH40_00385 [Clostridiales bacterium]|nr:hypothetical protein [Clostridiales bacterium]
MFGKTQVKRLIKKYGRTAEIIDGGGNVISEEKACIQPLRYKNKMYLEGTPTEIGISESGYYMYIGPWNSDMSSYKFDGFLYDGSRYYTVDRAEPVYFKEDIIYMWAVLRETQGAALKTLEQ